MIRFICPVDGFCFKVSAVGDVQTLLSPKLCQEFRCDRSGSRLFKTDAAVHETHLVTLVG